MLISVISLTAMGSIQKNVSTKVRPVGLINIKLIQNDNNNYVPPFMKDVVYEVFMHKVRVIHPNIT